LLTESDQFSVDNYNPPAPVLVSPSNNAFNNTFDPLIWSVTEDISELSFAVKINTQTFFVTNTNFNTKYLADGSYTWQVITIDSSSNLSLWSSTRQMTFQAPFDPGPRVGVTAPEGWITNTNALFHGWASNRDAAITGLFFSPHSSNFTPFPDLNTWSTNLEVTAAVNGRYYFYIKAVNDLDMERIFKITNQVDLTPPRASFPFTNRPIRKLDFLGVNYDRESGICSSRLLLSNSENTYIIASNIASNWSFRLQDENYTAGRYRLILETTNNAGLGQRVISPLFPVYNSDFDPLIGPNPLHLSREEKLHIVKMVRGSRVKIFTIDGELVWQSSSISMEGNLVQPWNMTDENGKRVAPGVYMVYICAEEDKEAELKLIVIE